MTQLNEELLQAWMKLSATIINPRVVEELSYKESQVCHVLYCSAQQQPTRRLTATELCTQTKMLKSQMNRTLNQLEQKGIITRSRSEQDKRQVYIALDPAGCGRYQEQHRRILALVDGIIGQLGETQARQTVELFGRIANIADNILSGK